MQRPKVKAADFVGKDAYLAQRAAIRKPVAVLCTLTVEDHTSTSGVKRYMLGGEPILTRDGAAPDGHGHHPYVTTAGSAPSLGQHVLLAYLPSEQAVIGTELAVSYMEELYPVVVRSVDATSLVRPGERADALMVTHVGCSCASSGCPTRRARWSSRPTTRPSTAGTPASR